jgi:hypothetical protein
VTDLRPRSPRVACCANRLGELAVEEHPPVGEALEGEQWGLASIVVGGVAVDELARQLICAC